VTQARGGDDGGLADAGLAQLICDRQPQNRELPEGFAEA
jgi:hypothetical protein